MESIIISLENRISFMILLNTLLLLCNAHICYNNDYFEFFINFSFINFSALPILLFFNTLSLFTQIVYGLFYLIFCCVFFRNVYYGFLDIDFYLGSILIYVLITFSIVIMEYLIYIILGV